VDSGNKGVPEELKQAANEMFVDYEIQYVDLQRRPLPKIVTRLPASQKVKHKELKDLSKIIEKNLHVFDNRLNVTAVQASYKVINSSEKDIPCVTVFVLGKRRIPVGESDLRKLDNNPFGVDLDVVEGYYQPCTNDFDSKSYGYPKPFLDGIGIGIFKDDKGRVGTLGGFLEDEYGNPYILSCEHVLNPDDCVEPNIEIVQPAEIDYKKACKYASSKVESLSAALEEKKTKMEVLETNDQAYGKLKKHVEKTQKVLDESIKQLSNVEESKRTIGKYCWGLKQNEPVEICNNNCADVYVDAAIAELNDEEADNIELKKDFEPEDDRCPMYGFKNDKDKGFVPTGHIVDLQEFDSHHDVKFLKIGRTTGLTVGGEFESTDFFVNLKGYRKNVCAGDLTNIPYILYCNSCEPLNENNQVDLSCIESCCTKCKAKIGSNVCTAFWAKNCMAIRRPKKPFCEEGDSGALVFDSKGRVWGMIFGVFSAEGINLDFGLATPLSVVLKALGRISGKTLTLW
jgi:hypothetical protein